MAPRAEDGSVTPLVAAGSDLEDNSETFVQEGQPPKRGKLVVAAALSIAGAASIGLWASLGESSTSGSLKSSSGLKIVGLSEDDAAEEVVADDDEVDDDAEEDDAEADDAAELPGDAGCTALGEDCSETQCCLRGGMNGRQCYAKTDAADSYAVCDDGCEVGAREGETEGTWDATGTFQPVQWQCKELGTRSAKGCEAFDNMDECPSYCTWQGDKCLPACSTFTSEGACWDSEHCMYTGDECMDACWGFSDAESCQPTDKCYWHEEHGACQMGWWLFWSHDSCDNKLGYMWNGTCNLDPCSAPGEDCRETQCCSMERGASGMTCFAKDDTWASCQETCDNDDWSCDALGNRTKYDVGCGWGGKSCESSKLCCNVGFVCAVKDEFFTGCVQTVQKSTWMTKNVEIPPDWEGTIVGGGRNEYEMQAAAEGEPVIGSTLYCFMAYLPGSYEEELVNQAEKIKASIYGGCDKNDLFHTWQSGSGGWDTGESTLTNTDVFINVWQQVGERGDYLNYDWTLKADPDCVVVPDRIRAHLAQFNTPAWAAVYVKNNGMDPGLGNNGFLGAVEVFSKKAVQIYLDNWQGCADYFGMQTGEDGYFKGCMDALGVGYLPDIEMFFPDHGAGACMQGQKAAFHPLKDPQKWQHCWDIVVGNVPF